MTTRQLGPTGAAARQKPTGGMMAKTGRTSAPLWKRVGELGASSAFLLYLSDVATDRLSLTQAAFFMLAATADAAGKPATRSAIMATYQEQFRGSIRNSYRQLLKPSRVYPGALGWLMAEENPDDSRENFLRLTKLGKLVAARALLALGSIDLEHAA